MRRTRIPGGSGWKEYQAQGTVCGIKLQPGLRSNALLPEPIFTPATKAEEGHDENISFEQACDIVGKDLCEKLRDLTLDIYSRAQQHALACGLVLADTKFEFGLLDGEIVLGDEVLTPDSSRYWPLETYQPGRAQPSYDKQYVRDYLESVNFNKQPPGPCCRPRSSPTLPRSIRKPTSQSREKISRSPRRLIRVRNWVERSNPDPQPPLRSRNPQVATGTRAGPSPKSRQALSLSLNRPHRHRLQIEGTG